MKNYAVITIRMEDGAWVFMNRNGQKYYMEDGNGWQKIEYFSYETTLTILKHKFDKNLLEAMEILRKKNPKELALICEHI